MCNSKIPHHKYLGLSPHYKLMQSELAILVTNLKSQIKDLNNDDRMLEIRLCVDNSGVWSFRTGPDNLDEIDSKYHATSLVCPNTVSDDILTLLIDQILEQVSD